MAEEKSIDRSCPKCGKETNCNLDDAKIVRHDEHDGSMTFACPACGESLRLDDTRRVFLPPIEGAVK